MVGRAGVAGRLPRAAAELLGLAHIGSQGPSQQAPRHFTVAMQAGQDATGGAAAQRSAPAAPTLAWCGCCIIPSRSW